MKKISKENLHHIIELAKTCTEKQQKKFIDLLFKEHGGWRYEDITPDSIAKIFENSTK